MAKRILHLSDLHFGRVNAPALDSLRKTVLEREKNLSLIIVTGDWTQRARAREFQQAAEFISSLSVPVVSVPGNHDVPLYDLPRRWLAPYSRYAQLRPLTLSSFQDDDISIVGVSTVNPFRIDAGAVHKDDVERARAFFRDAPAGALKIVACHHPLFDPREKKWLRPERLAKALVQTGADVVLSGHSHLQWVEVQQTLGRDVLHISAGTGISNRLRTEVNNFHIFEIESAPPRAAVTVETYDLTEQGFIERGLPTRRFVF
ncbi:metallophosphoesterase [soil metagenome]